DFCVLLSSVAAIVGGAGLGAYAAVNSLLDAMAARNAWSRTVWLSVGLGVLQPDDALARSSSYVPAPPELRSTVGEVVATIIELIRIRRSGHVAATRVGLPEMRACTTRPTRVAPR